MTPRNLEQIRAWTTPDLPGFGALLYETLRDLQQAHANLSAQVNGNGTGLPDPPPQIGGLSVTGANGHHNIAITDASEISRGIHYFAEFSSDPQFSNPHTVAMGTSRNLNHFLGSGTYYWRAYSSYATSGPSAAVYFGSAASPIAVAGGGSVGPPALQASQGSGTGSAGVGLQGFGKAPYRSITGRPPER